MTHGTLNAPEVASEIVLGMHRGADDETGLLMAEFEITTSAESIIYADCRGQTEYDWQMTHSM